VYGLNAMESSTYVIVEYRDDDNDHRGNLSARSESADSGRLVGLSLTIPAICGHFGGTLP
jgi:hypothetical protein